HSKDFHRRRSSLDILNFYYSKGVSFVANEYVFLVHKLLEPTDSPFRWFEERKDAHQNIIFPDYPREERRKRFMEFPQAASLNDVLYWTEEISGDREPRKMNEALKVLYIMRDFFSFESSPKDDHWKYFSWDYHFPLASLLRGAVNRLKLENFKALA